MKFKEIDHREDIPVKPKVSKLYAGESFEDYMEFIMQKVNEDSLEMYFLQDDHLTYAYFEEEEIVYIYSKEEGDGAAKKEKKKEKGKLGKLGKSHLFTKLLMIFAIVFSSLPPITVDAAGYFAGTMKEDPTVYVALSGAKFTTPTGSVKLPGFLNLVESDEYSDRAFTFTNPNRIQSQPTVTLESLPDGANEPLLVALLSYREKFSLQDIADTTGINVTQRQLDEATQLAVWVHASTIQIDYQIDANSITDTAVRSLATEINTWASQQVSSLTDSMSMGDYLFPAYKPTLEATNAKMTKTGDYAEYGPYTVSGQKSARYAFGVLGGTLVDSARKEVKTITADQQFFARFPVSYTGDKSIRLQGKEMQYTLSYGLHRMWLDKAPSTTEVRFSVGGSTGTNGMIQVNAVDSVTGKAIEGVGVEISTTSPLTTITTNNKGVGEYTASLGTYNLKFSAPSGYMTPADQQVQISFAGDIQTVNLNLAWSKAVVNFYAVDAQTLTPAGDSEAFIYDSEGKAVKRVALAKGKVSGVVLQEGDYTFVQYKASDGYAINTGTQFKAVAGKVTDVTVAQDPNAYTTTISIEGASENDTWVYTLSTESKVLFKLNGRNSINVPLPDGKYSVMAHKSDGTVMTAPLNFTTVLNGKTEVILKQERGEEKVTFSIVDTVKKEAIPNITLGLFDEDHNLITHKTADENGIVTFENIMEYTIYQVNVVAAPEGVSGYFSNGNRFLGQTRSYELELYSQKEIQEVTKVDTIYRVPNVTYVGATYEYPGAS